MTSEHRPTSSRITELLLPPHQAPPKTADPGHPEPPNTADPARPKPADPARPELLSTADSARPEPPRRAAPGHPAPPDTSAPGRPAPPAPAAARPASPDPAVTTAPRPAAHDTAGNPAAARSATPVGRAGVPEARPGVPAPAAPRRPAPGDADPPAVETTARLRPIRPTDRTPPPDPRAVPPRPSSAPSASVRSARPASGQPVPPRPAGRPGPPSAFPAPARPASAPARPAPGPVVSRRPVPSRPSPGPVLPGARPTAPAAPTAFAPPAPAPAPYGRAPGHPTGHVLPPEAPVETTTRLRPVRERRSAGRTAAVAACAVLGLGLIGGALAGVWLAASEPGKPAEPAGYAEARDLWHNAPVDTLFPRTLAGPGAGPGSAARTWTRIVVAPDAACSPAVLAKGLLATVEPLGCERVLRATYTDATASSVITVGLVFTRADATAQRTLGQGLTARLGQDVPPALSGPSTVAARFGDRQRASWWTSAPADLPVVVTAVSGFADGRTVDAPQPADRATAKGRTDAVAQSGLGHEARGITERLERLLRTTAVTAAQEKAR
ncbi:hypothetical protein ACFUJU_35050 [Streptomyces sp. NPDC057235]|uniref:hypothetical protein n=1 Tax=Streptomyces sp. NPDC057235 TaxID=3346058 RepID=UPI00363E1F99